MRPFVSVIVPNYNHATFLVDRLDSILNQTYQNLEIILLDDHSTDESLNILRKYESHDKVVSLDINSENSGNPFLQWIKGVKKAKGEWVWIAESDDVNNPEFLAKLIEQIEEDTSLCWCRSIVIDEHGAESTYLGQEEWPNTNYWKDLTPGNQTMKGEDFILNYLYNVNQVVNASSVIFKAEYFPLNIQHTLKSFRLCGDWLIWIHIIAKGNTSFVDQPLNKFRIHSSTVRYRLGGEILVFFECLIIIDTIQTFFTISAEQKSLYTQYLVYIYTNRYNRKQQLSPANLFRFVKFLASFNFRGFPLLLKHLIEN